MRVHRIIEKTYAEGPGCRFCIWVQGCSHECDGCFAADLWRFDGGYEISVEEILLRIQSVASDIEGITFLGGEPLEYAKELAVIANYVHSLNKNVITFTGYVYEKLLQTEKYKSLLDETDLLIDGKFEKALLDYSRPLVGSSNQRFIYLSDGISENDIKSYKNRFEIRVSETGKTEFNGMGNIEKLSKQVKEMGK